MEIWFESINIDKKSALEPKQINGAWLEQIWTKNRKIETWFQSKIQKAKSLFSWPTSCPKPLPYKYTSNSDLKNTILQLKKPHTNIKKPWKKSQVQTRFQIDSSQTKDSGAFLEASWSFPDPYNTSIHRESPSVHHGLHLSFWNRIYQFMHHKWILIIYSGSYWSMQAIWIVQLTFSCRFKEPPLLGFRCFDLGVFISGIIGLWE